MKHELKALTSDRKTLIAEARLACMDGSYAQMSELLMQCADVLEADIQSESEPVAVVQRSAIFDGNTIVQYEGVDHLLTVGAELYLKPAECTRCKVIADDNNEHIQRAYRAEALLAQCEGAKQLTGYEGN